MMGAVKRPHFELHSRNLSQRIWSPALGLDQVPRQLPGIVPYFVVALPQLIRAAVWRPLTIDGTTEDGIHLRCRLPDVIQTYVYPSYGSGLTTTVARRFLLREQGRVRAATLGSLVTREELATTRLIKIDVEGAEDRVLAGALASVDALAADAELVVEVMPKWWSDPQLRPIDVLRPFLERGFHVYLLPCNYWPWRYLWPRDVGAPQRLRDFAVLERRGRLDVVLSRSDADAP
jgi:hypothetical protein